MQPEITLSGTTRPHQSALTHRVENEQTRQSLTDDLMTRTGFSDTLPFMDWIDEAAADKATQMFAAYSSELGQWSGFLAYRMDLSLQPVKPGRALIEVEVSVESLYITEQDRGRGMARSLMMAAVDDINAAIQNLRTAKSAFLKLEMRITFVADCLSAAAERIARSGLAKLASLQNDQVFIQDQITLIEDE